MAAGAFLLIMAGILLVLPLATPPILTLGIRPAPARFYDRTGARLLMEVVSASAAESRWFAPFTDGDTGCALMAFLAARGIPADDALASSPLAPLASLAGTLTGGNDLAAEAAAELGDIAGAQDSLFERARLAGALAARYDRRQLAEWLLNIRRYGNRAIGIDDAALTYFNRHAENLSTAQCATLEALAQNPERAQDPVRLRNARDGVLTRMMETGYIGTEERRTASAGQPDLRIASPNTPPFLGAFLERVFARLAEQYSQDDLARSGLKVITTLDLDFSLQVLCAAQNNLARNGSSSAETISAIEGSPCRLAALLGPAAAGESAVDFAIAVLDPETGELLAYFDSARGEEISAATGEAGTALLPFAYLSAFTRGFAPASMLLDIPAANGIENLDGRFLGPISARSALQHRRLAAAGRMLERAGSENLARTLDLLGLGNPAGTQDALADMLNQPVDLLNLTRAYAVLAGSGMQILDAGSGDPVVILRVVTPAGSFLPEFSQRQSRQIIGADLTFLVQDVLAGPEGRAGNSAAALEGSSSTVSAALGEESSDGGAWAFAFTPRFVVGVRAKPDAATRLTSQSPWVMAQAAAGWALRGLPAQQWRAGEGVVRREVCVPSGLLPSRYCPNVVTEIFLAGAEPVQSDTYYRPVTINRETDRLATLWTPLILTEQKVYFQLAGEARTWAEQSGFPLPPETYDTLPASYPFFDSLQIASPAAMNILNGEVVIRGTAAAIGMEQFLVQAGPGLYPVEWYTLGEGTGPVRDSKLATWDTIDADGIWSLQLLALYPDGKIDSTAIPVTIDNTPPEIRWVEPATVKILSLEKGDPLVLQVEVSDNLALAGVDFRLDGTTRGRLEVGPFSIRWEGLSPGVHTVDVCAQDMAGNENCTSALEVDIKL